MNYALRFYVNREGVSYRIHGRDIPGYPASPVEQLRRPRGLRCRLRAGLTMLRLHLDRDLMGYPESPD